ncbi:MAG TPA: UDP-N-acetylmuramoyl-tripeptide--D-alanyl-D-alanine ligase [Saprospiraceae bacterium]|nr:UDP-N-acetylmuramoyl-tripeptide--D-alanyl-D-alanine ligase [Saprospiraceae bacterium]
MDLFELYLRNPSISTDTRTIESGDIFFALKGDQFDGNIYIDQAIEKGAILCVSDDQNRKGQDKVWVTQNVLTSLQDLAHKYRKLLKGKVMGLTGSNGKTTTKELLYQVLSQKYKTHATKGNLNNHIGVPLTLLSVPIDAEMIIIEMGANHQGEIHELCEIADPYYGLITNCGKAHLEGFGGIYGVIKGKTELYRYLNRNEGTIFYNPDDRILVENLPSGTLNIPYMSYQLLNSYPTISVHINDIIYDSPMYGDFNAGNIVCAVSVGSYFKVDPADMQKAIQSYVPANNRSQFIQFRDAEIFLDAYNANPTSMEFGLNFFDGIHRENKMVILGDMLELGEYGEAEHQKMVDKLKTMKIDRVLLVGPVFKKTRHAFPVFENVMEAQSYFDDLDIKGCSVYIKGSRGIQLEKLVNQ